MSGFDQDDLYDAEQAQLSAAAGTNAVASLQAGHPFSLLLAEDDRQRTTALETLLDTVADPSTRFARVNNPLRARLTLERLLIQVIQDSSDRLLSDPAQLVRAIASRRAEETRVILVIESAETLHPEVLQFFGRAAALFPDGSPRLQILFVGRPAFTALLADPDSGFDEQTALLEQYRPLADEPVFAFAAPDDVETLPQQPLPFLDTSLRAQFRAVWEQGLLTQMTIVGGVVTGCGAVVFAVMIATTTPPDLTIVDTTSALAELPDPGQDDPDPPAPQPGPPATPEIAALRQEFEAFLVASGRDLTGATPAQRRTAYNDFLAWRLRTTGRPPP